MDVTNVLLGTATGRVFTQAIGLAAAGPFLFLVGSTVGMGALARPAPVRARPRFL
jgi:hypothetical protein